jgi:pimeloyl-ACP methyl ester carboxylesterase
MKKLLNTYIPRIIGCYFNVLVHFSKKAISKKAFILFCTPRKGKVQPQQKSFLIDAKDDLIETNGITIQTYRWKGERATILLMHGWESNSFRWRDFISQLQAEDYNIIAMDAPAHGYSSGKILNVPIYAECAKSVIDIYKPKYIIGHSIGGMTMVYNQHKYPNSSIEKLVSLAAPSELFDFVKQFKTILGLKPKMINAMEEYFTAKFGFKFKEFSTSKFVKSINKKGLLIHDERDSIAPIWTSEQVHENWKNSEFIKTKGLGHSLHQDKVRNQVIEFLKS